MRNYFVLFLSIFIFSACNGNGAMHTNNKEELSGAGATFPLPFYNIVFKKFMQDDHDVSVTYGGIGSGGGIRSLRDKAVDFGASDAFLSDKELQSMHGDVLHIPTCMGGVAVAYNLSHIDSLRLTGALIADIFMGRITQWDDPRLVRENPGLPLPELKITPVYRSDGSGTTFVFSDYLSKVSTRWSQHMGRGKALKWDAGIAAKGNPGIAGIVQQTRGAIGYVGSEYALTMQLPSASIQNKAGRYVKASLASISAAGKSELPDDMRVSITNSDNPEAYPISLLTWILVYKNQAYDNKSEQKARALCAMLNYVLSTDGQGVAAQINYAPLSDVALQKANKILASITYNGAPVFQSDSIGTSKRE